MNRIRIASLFSGCGGLDLGFLGGFSTLGALYERLNTEVVFANDIDDEACSVYRANHAAPMVCGDIRRVPIDAIPDFDVLIAGFPCQPFSTAGARRGVDDEGGRGTLFEECERIIREKVAQGVPPRAFLFENVRGILSSYMPDGKTTVPQEITSRMRALGYNVSVKLLCASDYGVPQNRYRVFIIGTYAGCASFDFNRLQTFVYQQGIPSRTYTRQEKLVMGYVLSFPTAAHDADAVHWAYTPATQKMVEAIGKCYGAPSRAVFDGEKPLSMLAKEYRQGHSWKNIPREKLTPRFQRIRDDPQRYRSPNFFRRFALGEISGTVIASAQPENSGITHPTEDRRLTVREVARIQSFPEHYDFSSVAVPSRYKVIGNAVPPVLGWVLAKNLLELI